MDTIIDILFQNKEKKLVPSVTNLGEKRKKEFDQFGFGVSSAAHSIRLTEQLIELMTTGTMTFPRPNANFLLDIRLGKYKKEEIETIFADLQEKAKKARDNSVLPDKPDYNKVNQVYQNVVMMSLLQI
jgi:hypothetical protein